MSFVSRCFLNVTLPYRFCIGLTVSLLDHLQICEKKWKLTKYLRKHLACIKKRMNEQQTLKEHKFLWIKFDASVLFWFTVGTEPSKEKLTIWKQYSVLINMQRLITKIHRNPIYLKPTSNEERSKSFLVSSQHNFWCEATLLGAHLQIKRIQTLVRIRRFNTE